MKCHVRSAVLLLLLSASFATLCAQHVSSALAPLAASAAPPLNAAQMKKVGSGLLLHHIGRKLADAQARGIAAAADRLTVSIYAAQYPSPSEIAALEQLGVRCMPESWIPPLENHPLGFFLAQVPADKVGDVLSLASVLRMDTAEREARPLNNTAAVAVHATLAWTSGWTGSGVKVAVLDSGLDYTLPKTELPDSLWCRNYAYYPDSLNSTFFSNTVTGHGTHVAGTVCGKGGYSTSPVLNTGNGGGAYKGMAPDAKLVFLKIGQNANGGATTAAEVQAIKAAVDTFHVKVINMSYGGWDAYHDGSNPEAQAADYAYSKGTACFFAAGNEGGDARHYSGTVAAGSTTGDITVNVSSGSNGSNTALWFNLVWVDGPARNNLSLQYFDAAHNPMSSIIQSPTTESARGTESKYSHYNFYLPGGAGTYYLRVTNPSTSAQFFHIYDDWGNGVVTFASPDPAYTVGSPAHADHAMAVAAYTSRRGWTSSSGGSWTFGYTQDDITPFSSRGPRVDGVQKPNIAAPGSQVISIRDRDVYKTLDPYYWIDNDGTAGGDANYYAMQGTSMASPVAAGCAALLFQHTPAATPQQVYDALTQSTIVDGFTGSIPNATWGYGKLDVNAALSDPALPVELASFTASARAGSVLLAWRTASEVNNYGFDIERRQVVSSAADPSARAQTPWTKLGFAPGHGTDNRVHEYAFTDRSVPQGRYAYRLKQIDRDGRFEYGPVIEASADAAPLRYELGQNYPNPFNPSTSIRFTVAQAGPVKLVVYDVLGRPFAQLVNKTMESGSYVAEWTASHVPSGVYFCRLEAGAYTSVRKLLLQK